MKFNQKKINRLIILGGGITARLICQWATKNNLHVKVVSSTRLIGEVENGISFLEFLKNNAVDFHLFDTLNPSALRKCLGETSGSISVSLGAPWVITEEIIDDVFNRKLLNLHGHRLPQNRGAGGFSWQIMMGNRLGFCQLHLLTSNLDSGDILATEEFVYPASCRTPNDYRNYFASKNCQFFIDNFKQLQDHGWPRETIKQAEYLSTYWPRLHTDTHGWIDWSNSPLEIERFICAFDDPYKGASTRLNGNRVHLKNVCLDYSDGAFHPFQTGLIFRKSANWLCVSLGTASLVVQTLHDADQKCLMSTARVGDRLVTNPSDIEETKTRVSINPVGDVKSIKNDS